MRRGWLLLVICALAGCRGRREPDVAKGFPAKTVRLDGVYGVARAGLVEPVLRVNAVRDGYTFEERTTGEWKADAETPHTATKADVRAALGGGAPGVAVFGLATDSVWLLRVPPGWSGNGVTTKSGYLLVSEGKLAAAEKIALGGR